jgi:MoaA/NifB/PqqE/SkfB family radical SAM enzyme
MPIISGIHVEPTNICTLKCAGCARTQFINQWPRHWKNYSIDIDHLIKFLDIDLVGIDILLCGNYGDPIYHPEFLRLAEELKLRKSHLKIVTNGSYKSKDWWSALSNILTPNDTVVFSVDGTPENFTTYRQNADWDSIYQGMQVIAAGTAKSIWKYIPFNYNIDDISAAESLSKQLGISEFEVVLSDRFDQHTIHLIPPDEFVGGRKAKQSQFKSGIKNTINPRCSKGDEHYIAATGHYAPCCYSADHRFYYKTIFGKNKNAFSIGNTTLTDILNRKDTIEFYDSIPDALPTVCQYNCPA